MKTKVALIDVDDTLADLASAVCDALERRGTPVPVTSWWTHDWCIMFNMGLEDLRKMLREEVDYPSLELLSSDWVHFIGVLQDHDIQPLYLTARGNVFGHAARELTASWLTKVGISTSVSSVIPTNFKKSKAEIAKDIGVDVVLTIDDYLKEVLEYRKLFPQAMNVLIDSPLNRNNNADVEHRMWCPRKDVRKLSGTFIDWRRAVTSLEGNINED